MEQILFFQNFLTQLVWEFERQQRDRSVSYHSNFGYRFLRNTLYIIEISHIKIMNDWIRFLTLNDPPWKQKLFIGGKYIFHNNLLLQIQYIFSISFSDL